MKRTNRTSSGFFYRFTYRLAVAAVAVTCPLMRGLRADDQDPQTSIEKTTEAYKRNVAASTLRGWANWGDIAFFHDWRIQRNIATGQHRLLDVDRHCLVVGTLEECQQALDDIRESQSLGPMTGKAIILLHGVLRSSKSMKKLEQRLRDENYQTFAIDYPSTQVEISEAANQLDEVIRSLEGIEEISFVVHSMGGLVVRSYLDQHHDDRIHRMVMIGTPNFGAQMADYLKTNPLYRAIYGPAGNQLGCDPEGYIASLPCPQFEFAIIAGGRRNGKGFNPLLPGDDDGTVTVDCTMLPGATDSVVVPVLHSWMVRDRTVMDYTVSFLADGRLRKDEPPQPIAKTIDAAPRKLRVDLPASSIPASSIPASSIPLNETPSAVTRPSAARETVSSVPASVCGERP